MMKTLFLILALTLVSSCGRSPLLLPKETSVTNSSSLETSKVLKTANLTLNIFWLTPVTSGEETQAILIAKKNNQASDLPSGNAILLWMPSMGHGSSPITVTKVATGVYQLTNIYFIMDGFWQLKVQLKNGSTLIDEVNFEYTL